MLFYLLYIDNYNINQKSENFFNNYYGFEYICVFVLPVFYIILGIYELSYELFLIDKLLANFIIFFYLISLIYIYMFMFSFYISK